MMTWVYSGWLGLAAVGETVTVDSIAQQGATLGGLSAAAIWAAVALVSIVGLIKLYKDKQKDEQELKSIIGQTTQAITKNTEVLDKLSDKIDQCPKR